MIKLEDLQELRGKLFGSYRNLDEMLDAWNGGPQESSQWTGVLEEIDEARAKVERLEEEWQDFLDETFLDVEEQWIEGLNEGQGKS